MKGYNEELKALGPPHWFDVSWLYSECYLYRRLNTLFARSRSVFWKEYDVFGRQKLSTFRSSRPAVLELAKRYHDLVDRLGKEDKVVRGASSTEAEEAEKVLFIEMCEICLWGNATDLSLLTSLTYEDIQKLQGSEARKASEKNIVVNDISAAFNILYSARRSGRPIRVDIVLDNAGFELYVDLILAGYLLATGLASQVVLHPKAIPWFVSDVIPKDFHSLLDVLGAPSALFLTGNDKDGPPLTDAEAASLEFLSDHWARLEQNDSLVLAGDEHVRFWTNAGSFWRMPQIEPALFEDLKKSDLIIFKGDLNYRKLTGDVSSLDTILLSRPTPSLCPKSNSYFLTSHF